MNDKNYTPNYKDWVARDRWTDLEAACVMSALDRKYVEIYRGMIEIFPSGFERTKDILNIIRSWERKGFIALSYAKWPMLCYINKYISEGFEVPEELLSLSLEKFKRLYNAGKRELLPDDEELAEPFAAISKAHDDKKSLNSVLENSKHYSDLGKKGGSKIKYNESLQKIIDIEVSQNNRGCTKFKRMMEDDYMLEASPTRDDELYSTGCPDFADDLYLLDGCLHFKDNGKSCKLSLNSIDRYFTKAKKKQKKESFSSAEAN